MKTLITLLGALVIAGAAQAAQPQSNPPPSAVPNADAATVPQDEAKKPGTDDRTCLRYTGTRIADRADARTTDKKRRTCNDGSVGRAYTREDLDATGEINIADALRKLDPSIH